MTSEPRPATDILWLNEEEYYPVCQECLFRYGSHHWNDRIPVLGSWEQRAKAIHNELEQDGQTCDLCEYDIPALAQKVVNGTRDWSDVPELVRGEVFDALATRETINVELSDEEKSNLEPLEQFHREMERAREVVKSRLGIDEIPSSLKDRQNKTFDELLRNSDGYDIDVDIDELVGTGLDRIIAKRYARMRAEYRHALLDDYWDVLGKSILDEMFGKAPGMPTLFNFWDEWHRRRHIEKDTERESEALSDEMGELLESYGEAMRTPFEDILDTGSNKDLARFLQLLIISHHEQLKWILDDEM